MVTCLSQEMLKYSESEVDTFDLNKAMQVMIQVVTYANDIMHQGAITGHNVSHVVLTTIVACTG